MEESICRYNLVGFPPCPQKAITVAEGYRIMTDNWDSESGQTKFLDESGNLVDDMSSWGDSQKLDCIRKTIMVYLGALCVDLLTAAQRKIEDQKIGGHSCYAVGYEEGAIEQMEQMKYLCRHLLAICGNNNNQTGGIIND